MGMYTELNICCRIKDNKEIISILQYMISGDNAPTSLPDHPLFHTYRWAFMLLCSSYYFVPDTVHLLKYDNIGKYWSFISRSDFKNYDDEVNKFIDWILPHVDDVDTMIGYSRYEEDREPVIYYSNKE